MLEVRDMEEGQILQLDGTPPIINELVMVWRIGRGEAVAVMKSNGDVVPVPRARFRLSLPGVHWDEDDITEARRVFDGIVAEMERRGRVSSRFAVVQTPKGVERGDEVVKKMEGTEATVTEEEEGRLMTAVRDAAVALEISCRLYRRDNPPYNNEMTPDQIDHEHLGAIFALAAKLDGAQDRARAAGCDELEILSISAQCRLLDLDLDLEEAVTGAAAK